MHNKKSLFQQKFQKKLYHFNRNSLFKSVDLKMIQLDIRSRTKNPTPSVDRNPTPPKNIRPRLRNPGLKTVTPLRPSTFSSKNADLDKDELQFVIYFSLFNRPC